MTITELFEIIGEDKSYWEQALVYVNGEPADDVSFGLVAGTNTSQMIINIVHYEEFDLPDN
ncbi:MAG: hypothetical protein K2G77_08635 [Muribaculaceae bacterium]|nr:hypothetical protein [Muribaculaceae bacterium]